MDSLALACVRKAVILGLSAEGSAASSTADNDAIDLLSSAVVRAVEAVGRKARLIAESAGRSEVIQTDIELAMEDWDSYLSSAPQAQPLPALQLGLVREEIPTVSTTDFPQFSTAFANTTAVTLPTPQVPGRKPQTSHLPQWLLREIEGLRTVAPVTAPATVSSLPNGLAEDEARQLLAGRINLEIPNRE